MAEAETEKEVGIDLGKDLEPVTFRDRPIPSTRHQKPTKAKKQFMDCVREMEQDLSDFQAGVRRAVLEKLHSLHIPTEAPSENVNLHTHTFFSYNASGWSPSRYAWEARKAGLQAAGIIDFDVLDGLEEYLDAAELLGIRATVGIEVRAFLEPFANAVIDSPGEPGVHYIAGSGIVRLPKAGTPEEAFLKALRQASSQRNRDLIARINSKLPGFTLDYDADVLPMTAGGNATERHIISAYIRKSEAVIPDARKWQAYWSELLGVPDAAVADLEKNRPAMEEKVRAKLAKRGGLGYVQPDSKTFPPVGEIYAWVKASGGIPMDSWLDGTSDGEKRARELFECNRSLGALALNLIPDRNWNIANPEEKKLKLANLKTVVDLAVEYHMPLHIGTEGNKAGLPFVDDLSGPDLAPYKHLFISGARVLVGHTVLSRFAGFGYAGPEAEAEFGKNTKAKNAFFEAVGALPPVDGIIAWYLRQVGPEKAYETIRKSAKAGWWSPAKV